MVLSWLESSNYFQTDKTGPVGSVGVACLRVLLKWLARQMIDSCLGRKRKLGRDGGLTRVDGDYKEFRLARVSFAKALPQPRGDAT